MALTDVKLAFCYEYVVDCHRMHAMQRIGYSGKHPSVQASKWLEDPEIKQKIAELQANKMREINLSAFDVLSELKILITSDIKDFVDDSNGIVSLKSLPSSKTRAISKITRTQRFNLYGEEEITTRLEFWDKNSALEKLGKHFGVFEADNRQRQPLIQVNIGE